MDLGQCYSVFMWIYCRGTLVWKIISHLSVHLFCCCRKVLKQIAVAELQPDETVDAVREARLLAKVCGCGHVSLVGVAMCLMWVWPSVSCGHDQVSHVGVVMCLLWVWLFMGPLLCWQLDHPYIVKFHDSFMEGDSFCIITEYCEVSIRQVSHAFFPVMWYLREETSMPRWYSGGKVGGALKSR